MPQFNTKTTLATMTFIALGLAADKDSGCLSLMMALITPSIAGQLAKRLTEQAPGNKDTKLIVVQAAFIVVTREMVKGLVFLLSVLLALLPLLPSLLEPAVGPSGYNVI